jgi:broad specificity phosphatase PhoE
MALLFLVRHGLTAQTGRRLYGRATGIDLDARGVAQANQLIERFEGVRLTAIYSSPLERCVQTVVPLADARKLEVRTDGSLLEMDAGDWTGRTLAQVRRTAAWRTVRLAWSPGSIGSPVDIAPARSWSPATVTSSGSRWPTTRGRRSMSSNGS